MKIKKMALLMASISLLVMGGAKAVQASSVNYSFRLPTTGYRTTDDVKKTDNGNFLNYVTYNGRPDYRIDFWGEKNGSRYTTQSYFYGTGNKWAYYADGGSNYNGQTFYMVIKTGPTTWVEIDVSGEVTP